jgi:two-component system KDP operon response regulator KdpE
VACDVRLDASRCILHVDGRQVHVTPLEGRLLTVLRRRAATEDDLAIAIWGGTDASRRKTVRIHIGGLRQLIEPRLDRPRYLVTMWDGRYRFRSP